MWRYSTLGTAWSCWETFSSKDDTLIYVYIIKGLN